MQSNSSIFGSAPFLRLSLAFLGGVAISNLFGFWTIFSLFLLILFVSAFLYFKRDKQQISYITGVILLSILFSLGVLYKKIDQSTQFKTDLPPTGIYSGRVVEKSPASKNRFKYEVKLNAIENNHSTLRMKEKILVFISDSATNRLLMPGNQITFKSKLFEISSQNNPGEFSYQQYLRNRSIRYQTYVWQKVTIDKGNQQDLITFSLNIRYALLDKLQEFGLKNDEFAVLAALTLGENDYLSNSVKNSYAKTGAMHVLSVSGLHIGIIYLFITYLLGSIGKRGRWKIVRFSLLFIFLWLYAFITGLSPSVMRSATMFTFVLIGDSLGRKSNIYNSLAASAFFLTLIDPNLINDIGFQLSYLALLGIVYFQPKIGSLIQTNNKASKWVWDLFTVSIAAQIGTFPLSIYYFHQFPNYFLLSNYFVIPAAAILLYGTFLFYLTIWIPFFPNVIVFILKWVTKFLNFSVSSIENLPGSTISDLWISKTSLWFLIIFLIAVALFIENRKPFYLKVTLFVLLALVINFTYEQLSTIRQNRLVFYNTYNDAMLSIVLGKNHYFVSMSDSLGRNSETLLENCSGYFHTKTPQNLQNKELPIKNVKLHQDQLFVKNLLIHILADSLKSRSLSPDIDLLWNTSNSTITIKNKPDFQINSLKKSNFTPLDFQSFPQEIQLKKEGALIITF